ncbi:hypothetical protein [uncultured Paracoccus sp.]|uniref:hypothetical protein n=1 Tax=uncultured Paracoccus sp. TaxID=189685 RepID=UPI002596C10C|nr:hypothetical protein [uncultured Paracoccus sp.]
MTVKPLLVGQPVTVKGDAASAELVEVIQHLVREVNRLAAQNADLTARVEALENP